MRRRAGPRFGPLVEAEGVRFRLWAPGASDVAVIIDGGPAVALDREAGGWYRGLVAGVGRGARYRFRIDGGLRVPDPASRFQPEGIDGPSEVVDTQAFSWKAAKWRGRPWTEAVLYELHVGAFSPEGRYEGVLRQLDDLALLGVTAVELMPLAQFAGARGWGYDGVLPFAPHHAYGRPEDLAALVDAAHERGLMMILDVVYNHFGPDGNHLGRYAPAFFARRHHTPWGAGFNFDGRSSRPVRDFFIENALFWLKDFRFDGLRFDAVQAIEDKGDPHILTDLAAASRAACPDRHIHLILENDDNAASRLGPGAFDAQWNDDFHHAMHVVLTGEEAGYYRDFRDRPLSHLGRALAQGFAYQGEVSAHRGGKRRGEASGHLDPIRFVNFIQNHDQIGNRAKGERLSALAAPEAVEAALAILLLSPAVPMLFMGEETGTGRPFLFFCDFGEDLARAVRQGRLRAFEGFAAMAEPASIPDPNHAATFAASILDWSEAETKAGRRRRALIEKLLAIRAAEIVPHLGSGLAEAASEVIGAALLRVAWRFQDGFTLELAANLGGEPVSFPLPDGAQVLFATGGTGDGTRAPWSVLCRAGLAGKEVGPYVSEEIRPADGK